MKSLPLRTILTTTWFSLCVLPAFGDPAVRIQGVAAVSRVIKTAIPQLREIGVEVKLGEECGNGQALAALGSDEIDMALLSRPLSAEDIAAYPSKSFEATKIGEQTIALLVPRTVWESGVHGLKKGQIADLYEGKIESWKQVGGEDRSPKFFEPAHGHGVWEIFVSWLYGDLRRAPAVQWEVVADGAEAQNAVEFNNGAITVASVRWADQKEVFPLALITDAGVAIEPSPANVAAGKYPLSRSAYIVVGNKPAGSRRKILEFLRSEKGQAIVSGTNLTPVTQAIAPVPTAKVP